MSTNPEVTPGRADDELVTLISRWLARHLSDDDLRAGIDEIGAGDLSSEQRDALGELVAELDQGGEAEARGDLEMVARETLEAIALAPTDS